jgi:hypothetical protein
MLRVLVVLLTLGCLANSALACDLVYDPKYVEPTKDQLIEQSERAFVGRVVAFRRDDGKIQKHDVVCDHAGDFSGEEFSRCWDKRLTLITAILQAEEPIRGFAKGELFEISRSADAGADCGNNFDEGTYYLVMVGAPLHFIPDYFDTMPTADKLAHWRSLPHPVAE